MWDQKKTDKHTIDWFNKKVKIYYKQWFNKKSFYYNPQVINGEWTFEKISSPNTFPKFSNEIPFKLLWDKKYILNPKIIGIRWGIHGWEYELEHIGHKYSYQKEEKLSLIKK